MDKTVIVALIALGGTFLTVVGGIAAALVTNRRETSKSAVSAIEGTLRERITLRDEQIMDLREDLQREKEKVAYRDQVIQQLRNELSARKEDRREGT